MGEKNGHVGSLLEDSWFFGNSLLSKSQSSKIMVRCNSDPCPSSSSTKAEALVSDQDRASKMSSLLRTPSLPLGLGGDRKYQLGEEEDEYYEDEPRMGDLIRQAMPLPLPLPLPMPRRRLDRTPSLPPCRGKEVLSTTVVQGGGGVGRLSRRESSVESTFLLQEKGPIAVMTKLTRRASIDSSMLLPPKCTTYKVCYILDYD